MDRWETERQAVTFLQNVWLSGWSVGLHLCWTSQDIFFDPSMLNFEEGIQESIQFLFVRKPIPHSLKITRGPRPPEGLHGVLDFWIFASNINFDPAGYLFTGPVTHPTQ